MNGNREGAGKPKSFIKVQLKKSTMTRRNINKLTIVDSKESCTFTMGGSAVLMQRLNQETHVAEYEEFCKLAKDNDVPPAEITKTHCNGI